MGEAAYQVGSFSLQPGRQLLRQGVAVAIGRKQLALLTVLAEAGGQLVTKDEIMAAVWPNVIVEENAIQAQVTALRKVLGADADRISTVRGVGYRLATGDPVAEGAPRVDPTRAPVRRRRLAVVLVAMVSLLSAALPSFWLWLNRSPSGSSSSDDGRIAVLAFESRGGGAAAREFAADLSDQIATVLSDNQVPIISAADDLRRSGANAAQKGPSRNADLVVGGLVRGEGDALDAFVRLTDVREQMVVWSGEFRGRTTDREASRETVATHVAEAVSLGMVGRSGRVKLDATSLGAFIAGRESTIGVRNGGNGVALSAYRKVVAAAPSFSRGHSALAVAEGFEAVRDPAAPDAAWLREDARREAARSLSLNPHNGEAYLALELTVPRNQWAKREQILIRGVDADPSFEPTIMMEGRLLWAAGRNREALGWLERAHRLDGLHVTTTYWLGLALACAGRSVESEALRAQLQAQWPELDRSRTLRLWTAFVEDSISDGVAILNDPTARPTSMSRAEVAAWRTAMQGISARDGATKSGAARSTAAAAETGSIDRGSAALLLSRLGDLDAAIAQARAYRLGEVALTQFLFLPPAAALRRDPRFMRLAQGLGLVAYWRATGLWPDFCSEPDLPYDCRAEAARVAGVHHPA